MDQIIFKKRLYIDLKRELKIVYVATIIFLLTTLAFMLLVNGDPLNADNLSKVMNHITDSIDKSIREDPLDAAMKLLLLLAFTGTFLYLYLANKHERLIISALGIQYISPLRGVLNTFQADWFLRWEQVTDAYIQQSHAGINTSFSTLNLVTSSGTRKLQPTNWIVPESWQPPKRKFFGMSAGSRQDQSFDAILKTELVNEIGKHLTAANIELKEGSNLFDLGSHYATIIFTASLLFMLAYAVVDTFFVYSEVYIDSPPLDLLIAGGFIFSVIAYLVMQRLKIPAYICISLALMNGAVFAAAMHPGLLRLNQFTDTGGLGEYSYIRGPGNIYSPLEPGTPSISIQQPYEYWAQFSPGTEYIFRLRKGGLGFWQLDESSLIESYREFFLRDNSQNKDS